MPDIPTFVLSELRTGDTFLDFVSWFEGLRESGAPKGQVAVRMRGDQPPFLLLLREWKSRRGLIGGPTLTARLTGANSLVGLLVWLSISSRRAVAIDASVTIEPVVASYPRTLRKKLTDRLMSDILFTRIDEGLFGGSAVYRRARALWILDLKRPLTAAELRRHFATVSDRP